MVAEDYGYTAIENHKNAFNNFNDRPYYIEELSETTYGESDLTPIQKFYDGANIFITGSTGFLGKILVEKLLRSCPTVSTLYLLVRNKKGKNLDQRVDELFDDVIFDKMKKECPKYRYKVVGVAGDCSLPNLGISNQDVNMLCQKIDIVFHVAATVRFDEKLKTAVAINIRSPNDLLNIARDMTNLRSFIHVSTVYGNCLRKHIEEKIYPPAIDGKRLMMMCDTVPDKILEDATPRLLGEYPNTYAFTKQIAEDIVKQESVNMPAGIFRPAIVVSTYKEPIPAWINNMYGPTGVTAGAGVGLLRVLHCDSEVNANLVPVDMCVNSLITSAWEVSSAFEKAKENQTPYEVPVYNYESGSDQPITWGKFMKLSEEYGITYPSVKCIWYYSFNLTKYFFVYCLLTFLLHTVPAVLCDTLLLCLGKTPRLVTAYKKIHKFSSVISYFSTRDWKVDSDRVRNQQMTMCERDRQIFFSNLKELDWILFFKSYCMGMRIYILQDPLDTLDIAKIKWTRLFYAHQAVKLLSAALLLWLTYWTLISLFGL